MVPFFEFFSFSNFPTWFWEFFRSGSTKKIISVLFPCKRMAICKPAGRDGLKVFNNSKLTSRKLEPNTCTLNILVTFLPAHPTSVRITDTSWLSFITYQLWVFNSDSKKTYPYSLNISEYFSEVLVLRETLFSWSLTQLFIMKSWVRYRGIKFHLKLEVKWG